VDGKRIAYVEQLVTENLQRVTIDPASGKVTGTPVQITHGTRMAAYPEPSPDGTMLAFQSLGKQEDIFLIGADGTGERQLTNDAFTDRVPRWSPDGKHIAFYSNRRGIYEIWTVRPDGSDLRPLTLDSRVDVVRSVWSPDGKRIAGTYRGQQSFIIELDESGGPQSLNPLPPLSDPAEYFLVWSWSPDGKWLAGRKLVRESGEGTGVVLYSIESRKYQTLTDDGSGPVWLNDSRRLLMEKQGKMYLLDAVTRSVQETLSLDARQIDSVGQLSKDNHYIYYSVRDPEADVWLITLR
jgi:Tol biopolymer transport system component